MRKILQSALVLLVALACVPAVGHAAGETSYSGTSENRVLVLLNDIRHEHGLSSFVASRALRAAARQHSADMLARGYFEHDGPGESFDKRIRRFLKSPLVGENIAWGTGRYSSPASIVRLWMNSPPHRRIILMPTFNRVGLGVAMGSFKGNKGAVMATADFSS